MTRISSGCSLYQRSSSATASPLRFIYVIGLTSVTFSRPRLPLARIARPRRSFHFQPCCAASLSTTRKPTLCLVRSYSAPGLPRPITSFIGVCLTTILQAHRQELRQAGLDDFLLCFLEIVGHAIKLETALGIVDHKSGAR